MSNYKIKQNPVFGVPDTYESSDELIEYLNGIGLNLSRVIIEFNALEDEISYYIGDLFNSDDAEKVYAFIGELMFKKKATKLLQLYHIECRNRQVDYSDTLSNLNQMLGSVAKQRNSVTHGNWLHSSPHRGVSISTKSNNKELSKTYKQFSSETLQNILNEITTVRAHLSHFHDRLKNDAEK